MLSHTDVETILSESTEWFDIPEEANIMQILLHKLQNIAVRKAKSSKEQKENYKLF